MLNAWVKLNTEESDLKRRIKEAETVLDTKAYAHYRIGTSADPSLIPSSAGVGSKGD